MSLQRLCFVAALASAISFGLAGCNGGEGGIPMTPGMPDSGMPDSTDGTQMPDTSEPVSPQAGGMSVPPAPADTPLVLQPNNPIMTGPLETPNVASSAATPIPKPSSTSAPFVPQSDRSSSVFRPSLKPATRTASLTLHLNGKKIPPHSYLWLESAFALHGPRPIAFQMQNSKVTLTGHTYSGPTGVVNTTSTATAASVTPTNANSIVSTFPAPAAKKMFMDGVIVYLPSGLPARQTVTWTARFQSSSPSADGIRMQWQATATAYSRFSTSYRSLGIDPAGTPQNFVKAAIPGARTEGTGQSVTVCPCPG